MPTITEKSITKTDVIFSEDRQHRYLLRKSWNKNKRKAMVIIINPSSANEVNVDYTTMYVINNLSKLDYGTVEIVNIYSKIDAKIQVTTLDNDLSDIENDKQLLQSAKEADTIIIAWGKCGENNAKIKERQLDVLEMLEDYAEKFHTIQGKFGRTGFHPLAPEVRSDWILAKYEGQNQRLYSQRGSKGYFITFMCTNIAIGNESFV